jgi:hypothetical protein
MKRICILLIFSVLFMQLKSIAQGCVAIKGTAGICGRPTDSGDWEMNHTQNNTDNRIQGDAAFAGYLISAGLIFKL